MKFSGIIEKLKLENKESIVLARCGAFVLAVENDARVLNRIFALNKSC